MRWSLHTHENRWRQAVIERLDTIVALLLRQQSQPSGGHKEEVASAASSFSYICPRCDKGFETYQKLGAHMRWCGKDRGDVT